jgi:DNA repair protein RadC
MEDYHMTTIRRPRPRPDKTYRNGKDPSQQLADIRQELARLNAAVRQRASCTRRASGRCNCESDARYLSEPAAAQYKLASDRLTGPEDTIRFCQEHFRALIERGLQEELHVLTLNAGNRVIRSRQVTVGLLNSTQVHAREVFRPAILDAAAGIILVHNHPSGEAKPSPEDFKVTDAIEAAGKILGIKLLDHIVVARDESTSISQWRAKTAC